MKKLLPAARLFIIGIFLISVFLSSSFLSSAKQTDGAVQNNEASVIETPSPDSTKKIENKTSSFLNDFINGRAKYRIVNLGPGINTEGVDYGPSISQDGKTLYFVSNREGSILKNEQEQEEVKEGFNFINGRVIYIKRERKAEPEPNSKFSHDFWAASKLDLKDTVVFLKAYNLDPFMAHGEWSLNTAGNEGIGSVAGAQLFFTACGRSNGYGSCDIYFTERKGNKYGKCLNIGENVNSKFWETQPSIDNVNGRLFFASARPNSFSDDGDNVDIWYSDFDTVAKEFLPAVNLTDINTKGKDWGPFIFHDGKTLFFSSDGYEPNFGGLDIYVTRYDEVNEKWSPPVNLGEPLNTEGDDCFISIPASGDLIYFSSNRTDIPGYQGNLDIYVVIPE